MSDDVHGRLMTSIVRVWDLPTRLFHWTLAACAVALVISAQLGGYAMAWHFRFGYAVLSLLLFRLIWGVVGGRWSRFSSFIYSPSAIYRYLQGRGTPDQVVGHNPLGAASVFALLVCLLIQVGSGLISDDQIANTGPLTQFVSSTTASLATFYHKDVGQWVLMGLVALHLVAIFFYLFKKGDNLIQPMISGDKKVPDATLNSKDNALSRTLAIVILLVCMAGVAWMSGL